MLSPVLRNMIQNTSNSEKNTTLVVELPEGDGEIFSHLLSTAIGDTVEIRNVEYLLELGKHAGLLQMEDIRSQVEDLALKLFDVENCAKMLSFACSNGFNRLAVYCRNRTLARFKEVCATQSFQHLQEQLIISLLDDDDLTVDEEMDVFHFVRNWTQAKHDVDEERLVKTVRFSLLSAGQLQDIVQQCGDQSSFAREARQALKLKKYAGGNLPAQVVEPVKGRCQNIDWNAYATKDVVKILGPRWETFEIVCVAVNPTRVFIGGRKGEIKAVSRHSASKIADEFESEMFDVSCQVKSYWRAFLTWEDLLVCASDENDILVIDVNHGGQLASLTHERGTMALALCPELKRFASGGRNGEVKIWDMQGPPSEWKSNLTLIVQLLAHHYKSPVMSLQYWHNKIAAGYQDGTLAVWCASSGELERVWQGHDGSLDAMVYWPGKSKLITTGEDSKIKVWSTESWECLQTKDIECPPRVSIRCLSISGSKLVGGTCVMFDPFGDYPKPDPPGMLKVWDLKSLACEHTFVQPHPGRIRALAASDKQVWAGVDDMLVLWGLRGS